MKFAKTLEEHLVPEWRPKYVDYKAGKKKVKATASKLRNAVPSPAAHALHSSAFRPLSWKSPHPEAVAVTSNPRHDVRNRGSRADSGSSTASSVAQRTISLQDIISSNSAASNNRPDGGSRGEGTAGSVGPIALERSPLHQALSPEEKKRRSVSYGSMGSSPPSGKDSSRRRGSDAARSVADGPPSLTLPDPMQPIERMNTVNEAGPALHRASSNYSELESRRASAATSPPVLRRLRTFPRGSPRSCATPRPDSSRTVDTAGSRMLLNRVLSTFVPRSDTALEYRDVHTITRVQAEVEREFLQWLLGQLKKCEEFYAIKEQELTQRFDDMHEQLDIMKELWYREKLGGLFEEDDVEDVPDSDAPVEATGNGHTETDGKAAQLKRRAKWRTIADAMDDLTKPQPTTTNPDASSVFPRPSEAISRDYERRTPSRKPTNSPPHRVAKRKLKKAYIEYYHGLEMLKAYVTLNRECFRKITKKFDKATGLKTSSRFMIEYVDKSYFGGAENKLDHLINDTEELFARYFEKGNRKEASQRLRSRESKSSYYKSVWRSGFYLGSGLIIGAYGLYTGIKKMHDKTDPELASRTGYVFQLWGGVALIIFQAILYAINFRVWARNRINYSFIFEFDPRHTMNYREFLELPSLFGLIFTICFWFSVYDFWPGTLDMIYFPVIYITIVLVLLLNPVRVWYYHSRRWFLTVLWRLFFSGFYPVEFKDFWMGDLLCSQTYALGNISLFFCLYAHDWNQPTMCNSSHSRLMGFFTTLPGIWRLLQCFRRYYNSKMWFPHLVNGGKYAFTILYYATLSIWRIDKGNVSTKAAFIFFAAGNAVYTTVWDLVMDWSLMNPYASHPFLRDNMGYKQVWPYYLAMFIDPIIRFEWILYIIYQRDLQHSALLSFLMALAEVSRRFMWCFFRMENEHIGNVGANRAYREYPLPFRFSTPEPSPTDSQPSAVPSSGSSAAEEHRHRPVSPNAEADLERVDVLRRRISLTQPSPVIRTITRVGRSMHQAHLNDYERKRTRLNDEADEDGFSSTDEEDGGGVFRP